MPKPQLFLNLVVALLTAGCQSAASMKTAAENEQKAKSAPQAPVSETAAETPSVEMDPRKLCYEKLSELPGRFQANTLRAVCQQVQVLDGCKSHEGVPIFHYDKIGADKQHGKRIFAMALIHGDEIASGSVARSWMERLEGLDPRNSWRVIPVANPDGLKRKTRMNANGVDLNRNFPTAEWDQEAVQKWLTQIRKDPRRYPGPKAGSEMETQCYIKHFDTFDPHFIISIHTPLAVLDFDGPKMKFPAFEPLPWISLGNFPGSLGRYMWKDRNIPVLTIELRPGMKDIQKLEQFDRLQDISGTVAIQADRIKNSEKPAKKSADATDTKGDNPVSRSN